MNMNPDENPEESKLQLLTEPNEIFIDIRETKIEVKDPYKGVTVTIKDYVLLHSSTGYFRSGQDINFLGLNRVFKEHQAKTSKSSITDRSSFWLRNSELVSILSSIVSNWIQEDSVTSKYFDSRNFQLQDWLDILEPKIITINPGRNWFGFIVSLNKIKYLFKKDIEAIIDEMEANGFSLFLMAENPLGNNGMPNVYLQIGYERLTLNIENREEFVNYYSLTIEKTNIGLKYNAKPTKLFSCFKNGDVHFSNIQGEFLNDSASFIEAISNFNKLFELMSKEKLTETTYKALILDLYDRNRNQSSVDLDDRLKNLINKTLRRGNNNFNRDYEYTWANLIISVVVNNAEDIIKKIEKNPYEISNLFSKKMVIQKMERIYSAVLSRKNKEEEIKKYLDNQLESYKDIQRYI